MVSKKDRYERVRGIRAHLMVYMKTGRLDELDRAHDQLKILMDLEELAPAEKK